MFGADAIDKTLHRFDLDAVDVRKIELPGLHAFVFLIGETAAILKRQRTGASVRMDMSHGCSDAGRVGRLCGVGGSLHPIHRGPIGQGMFQSLERGCPRVVLRLEHGGEERQAEKSHVEVMS